MGKVMSIITIGIDLAKNVFTIDGVNESGRAKLVKPKNRATSCYR
jgi:transposase